uniref:Cwf19-like C-terminal domain-containing protein n=1 Tax=Salix viminalis TaxID=40686 RepID=A0A6N2MSN5_SALVM
MLSGVKFIPRDEIDKGKGEKRDDFVEKRKESGSRKEKNKERKKKKSRHDNNSDDDLERIKKRSKKSKKWYSSDEHSSEESSDSESGSDGKSSSKRRKKKRESRKRFSSDEYSSSSSEGEAPKGSAKGGRKKSKGKQGKIGDDFSDDGRESHSINKIDIARKEMGLDWMLRPAKDVERRPTVSVDHDPEEPPAEEIMRVNPRELNPYFKDNGSGYPDDGVEKKVGGDQLPPSSVIGDGGASWRLKALKRAQEQAAREGRKLEEIVEERWDSLGQLAVSAASRVAAPSRAHLMQIKNRKKGLTKEQDAMTDGHSGRDIEKSADRGYLKDVSVRHPEMRAPKVHNTLSWGKPKSQNMSTKDAALVSAAASSLNKFSDDGSFLNKILGKQNKDAGSSVGSYPNQEENVESKVASPEMNKPSEGSLLVKEALSANQLAAKALQLRMKGKHEEAEKLMQEAESIREKKGVGENLNRPQIVSSTSRSAIQGVSARRKEDEDADRCLAQTIMQNKQYSLSGRADDEYDFDGSPRRKSGRKGRDSDHKVSNKNDLAKRILTQQERCHFCFENPNRPKHLVVSIANFTYLMLPQGQPIAPGHCCILPMQHDSSSRNVDNNVWDEIRNFKKCLIMMFSKQEKELVFLETVINLSQQRRHCLIECIPLPREIAKQAPLYFKKAIDEAEDEWSQHNAKKLIDTSEKGLRGSIPKDFPYFHVEFGLSKGFVHVIDDEKNFNTNLGLNVIRGMLQLPEEDMYRRRRHESVEVQKLAVAKFAQDWEPFDWTKQL